MVHDAKFSLSLKFWLSFEVVVKEVFTKGRVIWATFSGNLLSCKCCIPLLWATNSCCRKWKQCLFLATWKSVACGGGYMCKIRPRLALQQLLRDKLQQNVALTTQPSVKQHSQLSFNWFLLFVLFTLSWLSFPWGQMINQVRNCCVLLMWQFCEVSGNDDILGKHHAGLNMCRVRGVDPTHVKITAPVQRQKNNYLITGQMSPSRDDSISGWKNPCKHNTIFVSQINTKRFWVEILFPDDIAFSFVERTGTEQAILLPLLSYLLLT